MNRCPKCGYTYDDTGRSYYNHIISNLSSKRDKETLKILNKIINITLSQRADRIHNKEAYSKKITSEILTRLEGFSDSEIREGAKVYFDKEYDRQGYGYEYAVAIIQKEAVFLDEKRKYEKRTLDVIPTNLTRNEKNDGEIKKNNGSSGDDTLLW